MNVRNKIVYQSWWVSNLGKYVRSTVRCDYWQRNKIWRACWIFMQKFFIKIISFDTYGQNGTLWQEKNLDAVFCSFSVFSLSFPLPLELLSPLEVLPFSGTVVVAVGAVVLLTSSWGSSPRTSFNLAKISSRSLSSRALRLSVSVCGVVGVVTYWNQVKRSIKSPTERGLIYDQSHRQVGPSWQDQPSSPLHPHPLGHLIYRSLWWE